MRNRRSLFQTYVILTAVVLASALTSAGAESSSWQANPDRVASLERSRPDHIYSEARAINILGDVVGWSQTDDYWVNRGFLYTDEHGMLDLEELVIDRLPDELGYMLPESINTAGQISGNIRTYDSSFDAAFLLTPVSE